MNVNNNMATSVTMDLENLQKKYSNTLIKYRQATTDYINYLNSTSNNPCYKYGFNQKNIDDKCINHIWSKSGCTNVLPINNDIKKVSLFDLFVGAFFISSIPEPFAREYCYGKSTKYSKATEPNFDIIRPPLVTVNNASYSGTGPVTVSDVYSAFGNMTMSSSTAQQCKVECASNPRCTGATFASGKCQLRTGDSAIIPTRNSVAIVSKGKQLLMNMNNLNRELISINNQIRSKINTGAPIYKDFDNANNIKSRELSKQYSALNKERNNIKNLLDKHDKIESGHDENQLRLNNNYYTYLVLLIVACFLILLLIKVSYSDSLTNGQFGSNVYYILFTIIVIIIMINYVNRQLL
jgi:hypothetical protein